MKFFEYKDGLVSLAKEEIALYPNVKKVLARDYGGKVTGDPDGRKKLYAFKELTYVYFMCDFTAYPMQHGLTDKEAHTYATLNSGLPESYVPDDLIKSLMVQYRKEHLTPTKRTINTLLKLFTLNDRVIAKIETNLNQILELPTINREQIKELLEYQQKLIEIATLVPKQTKALKEAMNLLEEEEKLVEKIRGGEEKLSSMEPDNSIER